MIVFYSQDIDGPLVSLNREESEHCIRVLRHRAGDEISVIDGHGCLLKCRLLNDDPKGASAEIISRIPEFGTHPYRLTMAVCPTKNPDRFEWFAEKATEIGIDVIAPVFGERSERKVLKTDRLSRLVLSASKQSLKGSVPVVAEPVSVKDFILGSQNDDSLKMICYCLDDESKRVSIQDAIEKYLKTRNSDSTPPGISILIGPEGDFSPEEIALAFGRGWQPVHLGASRLRTESAALVAVTAVYLQAGESLKED